jgi:predicted PurR-regulated permease PerM
MSFKNYQNTTNHSDRDINKRFNQVAFNQNFEENNNKLLLSDEKQQNISNEAKPIQTDIYPHNESIDKNVMNTKNFIFKILNQSNNLFNNISDYFYSGIISLLIGIILLLLLNLFNIS